MNTVTLIFTCLVASALVASGAPTEPAVETSSASTTTVATASSTSTSTPVSTPQQTSSAPATDDASKAVNTTASMAVGSAHDQFLNSSSFTCYGRSIGYYGDIERDCKVYHFCLLGEYNGELVYQRISYLCLNDTLFDQQALDCVEPTKMSAPCKESPNFFESSNVILRQAIVGNRMHEGEKETTEPPKSA